MLEQIRSALRIDGNDLDHEVQDLIEAARADLVLAGVAPDRVMDTADPLIRRAVVIYCRAGFDYADDSAPRLMESYERLKAHLSMSEDYRVMP